VFPFNLYRSYVYIHNTCIIIHIIHVYNTSNALFTYLYIFTYKLLLSLNRITCLLLFSILSMIHRRLSLHGVYTTRRYDIINTCWQRYSEFIWRDTTLFRFKKIQLITNTPTRLRAYDHAIITWHLKLYLRYAFNRSMKVYRFDKAVS